MKGKKGSYRDLIFISMILLAVAMTILISYFFVGEFNTLIQDIPIVDSYAKDAVQNVEDNYTTTVDSSFLIMTVMMAIIMFVLAALIRVHPIWIILYIPSYIFAIFISSILSNIYQQMAATSQLLSYADSLPITSVIMTYLPLVIMAYGAILAIVMYKLWSNAE